MNQVGTFPWSKSYPVDIQWNSEIEPQTLIDLFDNALKKYGSRPCLHFMGKTLTYKQVAEMTDRFARGLQDAGIKKGSKVGLCLPNSPFYVIAYYGALKAGATVVNFNPLYAEHELKHQINDSGTELMVTLDLNIMLPKIKKQVGTTSLKQVVVCNIGDGLPKVKALAYKTINTFKKVLGKSDLDTVPATKEFLRFTHLLESFGKVKPVEIHPDDIAVLQYTGGTTGVPKGAALSHNNLATNAEQARLWFGTKGEPQDRVLAGVLPFFHVFGMTVQMNMALHIGAEIIMIPKFHLDEVIGAIKKMKPTIFCAVPSVYKAIAEKAGARKKWFKSLKVCISGGASLPEAVAISFRKTTGIDLVEGYGLSETSPVALVNPIKGKKKINSVGLPIPKTEVRIMDLAFPDKEVPIKVAGEICLRGPQVMQGYWQKPEETKNVLGADGFLRTGDVGYLDEDGYLFIVDRIKDMVIVNGMKAFPRNIEDAVMKHEKVSEVIALGVPDELRGEAVKIFVVPKAGETISAEELKTFLKDRLSNYEMPREIEFRESLPKTPIGKPDRKALKNMLKP